MPNNEPKEFQKVSELVDHLTKLGLERQLIVDIDGSTFPPCEDDVAIWNPSDPESPVAIYFHGLGDDDE